LQSVLTDAQALLDGDRVVLDRVASGLLKPLNSNLVRRPWGGTLIPEFKGLSQAPKDEMPYGEAFEIAAYDDDTEARQYPSVLRFQDGSEASLARVLDSQVEALLGARFVAQFGRSFPLLPKTLNIKELLSVQAHPEGNTEVYIIIDAEPGATIRLGFNGDMDAEEFKKELLEGRGRQERILSLLGNDMDPLQFHGRVSPWLAQRETSVEELSGVIAVNDAHRDEISALLTELKILYWRVLDSMNVVPVSAGQVIHNVNPDRFLTDSRRSPSAEVHALGNPEGKEILALEIRRPGPTFRAWDNVRFPIREIDVDVAIHALNLQATTVDDFIVQPVPVEGLKGVSCSVNSAAFRVEHLRPGPSGCVEVPDELPHCLHAIRGNARFLTANDRAIGDLRRGESAIVPIGVRQYRVESSTDDTEIIKVSLPIGG
jgi:hypothetical protein